MSYDLVSSVLILAEILQFFPVHDGPRVSENLNLPPDEPFVYEEIEMNYLGPVPPTLEVCANIYVYENFYMGRRRRFKNKFSS